MGTYSYDMLADRNNASDLLYIPYYFPERSKILPNPHPHSSEIVDSEESLEQRQETVDKVRLAIDLAYLDRKSAMALSFRHYNKNQLKND